MIILKYFILIGIGILLNVLLNKIKVELEWRKSPKCYNNKCYRNKRRDKKCLRAIYGCGEYEANERYCDSDKVI